MWKNYPRNILLSFFHKQLHSNSQTKTHQTYPAILRYTSSWPGESSDKFKKALKCFQNQIIANTSCFSFKKRKCSLAVHYGKTRFQDSWLVWRPREGRQLLHLQSRTDSDDDLTDGKYGVNIWKYWHNEAYGGESQHFIDFFGIPRDDVRNRSRIR